MHDLETPGEQAYFTRTELELHLARLALAVMRSAPETFDSIGPATADGCEESPVRLAEQLLRRAQPEHRPFAEARLLELARCLAGFADGDVHDLLSVTASLPARPAPDAATPR